MICGCQGKVCAPGTIKKKLTGQRLKAESTRDPQGSRVLVI